MKQLRVIIVFVVLANIALVAYLMLKSPSGGGSAEGGRSIRDAVKPLVADAAMDESAYDLKKRAGELNVIFISMDAMRYDHTGMGGNTEGLTPNLDQFAEEAVVFHHATTAASWTLPSHMSIWTSRWPSIHGVTNKLKMLSADQMVPTSLSPGIETFPDVLIRSGWTAAAFTGGAGVQASYGFGRNFSTYLDDKPFAGYEYSVPPALDWLSKNLDKHFFLFLHGYDAHGQHPLLGVSPRDAVPDYKGTLDGSVEEQAKIREAGLATIVNPGDAPHADVSAEDAKFLLEIYQQKVREADARLGVFLAKVKELGLLDKSIIVVLADHGEEFMEHGYVDHGATLCDHQLHVPLMIRFPKGEGAGVIDAPVRSIDVFPTLFDVLGVKPPEGADGKSLLPLLRGEKEELPIHAESDYRLFVHLRASRIGDKKLILDLEDGQRSLYDLSTDPQEQNDLSAGDARTTYEMEQDVRGWMGTMQSDPNQFLGVKEDHIKLF